MRLSYVLPIGLLLASQISMAQTRDPLSYVDPFIGTAKSNVYTRWGNEGGAYPGAVAPWGALQLTPETKQTGGYDHNDSTILFFSCWHHMSGYPSGSAGRIKVFPDSSRSGKIFQHADEVASPGYYKVRFQDSTILEATADQRVGLFRMSFPQGARPKIFVGGMGKILRRSPLSLSGSIGAVLQFSKPWVEQQMAEDGLLLSFPADTGAILIRISVSAVGEASAEKNIDKETGGLSFDEVWEKTRADWRKQLSVIDIGDDKEDKKKIFYTALYHSILLPWIISDVDGQYRGQDGLIHQTRGKNEYGGFSPWDTFRSLHPLLCLLFPLRQQDMVLSMMDIYRQTGYLPSDPMTGNHAVAVIADSWAKGIRGFDSAEAYAAMRKGILDTPYRQEDRAVYRQLGYIPSTYPESVTRTVEYAYDDWVIANFDKKTSGDNYQHLFCPDELFMLPRQGHQFNRRPGTNGYKEGDKWVYSYFVPQAPFALINLMGGKEEFVSRLDSALQREDILFDNETVFHIPYLFSYAGRPDKTDDWVQAIRDKRFSATPGGLPGNDDLGSMSSWYVFSALGFYPLCPGNPQYVVGTPLFQKATLHLSNGRDLILHAPGVSEHNRYVRRLLVDGSPSGVLLHNYLLSSSDIVFGMDSAAGPESAGPDPYAPVFSFKNITVSKKKLASHELFRVRWSISAVNNTGTRIVRLRVNGKRYASKNCLVPAGQTIVDSMDCRLYALGRVQLDIEGTDWRQEVEVAKEGPLRQEINNVFSQPLVKVGEITELSFAVRNIGGVTRTILTPVRINGKALRTDSSTLEPGEQRKVVLALPAFSPGWKELRVGEEGEKFRVYSRPSASVLLDISSDGRDHSGFGHSLKVIGQGFPLLGKDCYVAVGNAPALDSMGTTLTMMAWVYPTAKGEGLVDIFTKGDNHVLQVGGNSTLSFFAGGWGRGDCTVDLPADWWGHWHHIAGVCEGRVLKLYIDGALRGTSNVDGPVNLSVPNRWVLGRNEEFPGRRIFNGYIDNAKVFAEPLTEAEIRTVAGDRRSYH